MKSLSIYRLIGEALAESDPELSKEQVNSVINNYAITRYRKRKITREWCASNINLFYEARMEQKAIIKEIRSNR